MQVIPYKTDFHVDQEALDVLLEEPHSFSHNGNSGLFVTHALGPVIDMRGGLTPAGRTNVAVLLDRLNGHEDISQLQCHHWGHGWVRHLVFRAIDEDRQPTMAARIVLEWVHECLENLVLDDDAYYRESWEELVDNIRADGRYVSVSAPEDWAAQVAAWLQKNDPQAVENDHDGCAATPTQSEREAALKALGWYDND